MKELNSLCGCSKIFDGFLGGQQPNAIRTDQDSAMMFVIKQVLNKTIHILLYVGQNFNRVSRLNL